MGKTLEGSERALSQEWQKCNRCHMDPQMIKHKDYVTTFIAAELRACPRQTWTIEILVGWSNTSLQETFLQVQLITFPFKLINHGFIMKHINVLSLKSSSYHPVEVRSWIRVAHRGDQSGRKKQWRGENWERTAPAKGRAVKGSLCRASFRPSFLKLNHIYTF